MQTGSPKIIGSIDLTFRDDLSFLASRLPRFCLTTYGTGLAILFGIWVAISPATYWPYMREYPLWGVERFFSDMWLSAAIAVVGIPLLILAIHALQWRRFPAQNKAITYTVDTTGVLTTDAAGAGLNMPWSMVRRTRRTRSLFLMQLTTGAWRYLPMRAFATADHDRLWDLIQTGSKAGTAAAASA